MARQPDRLLLAGIVFLGSEGEGMEGIRRTWLFYLRLYL
jgi:hypothetical protein